jgi:hypothetical protein
VTPIAMGCGGGSLLFTTFLLHWLCVHIAIVRRLKKPAQGGPKAFYGRFYVLPLLTEATQCNSLTMQLLNYQSKSTSCCYRKWNGPLPERPMPTNR